MTGKELKRISDNHFIEGEMMCYFDWNAIAAEITPKPLTMEELVEMMNECTDEPIEQRIMMNGRVRYIWLENENPLRLDVLLDLINNKQKEQS